MNEVMYKKAENSTYQMCRRSRLSVDIKELLFGDVNSIEFGHPSSVIINRSGFNLSLIIKDHYEEAYQIKHWIEL